MLLNDYTDRSNMHTARGDVIICASAHMMTSCLA